MIDVDSATVAAMLRRLVTPGTPVVNGVTIQRLNQAQPHHHFIDIETSTGQAFRLSVEELYP